MKLTALKHLPIVIGLTVFSIAIQLYVSRIFDQSIIGIFYPVTFLISWRYGFWNAMISMVTLLLGAMYFVFEPIYSFKVISVPDQVRLLLYAFTTIPTCYIVSRGVGSYADLSSLKSRFKRSTSAINLGIWYCDLPFDELIWDRETKEHFWLPADAKVTINTFYERIHPDDREMTRLAIEKSISERGPYDIIYRTVHPTDPSKIKFIRAIGWTDYDETGKPIRFDGVTLDNTHLRKVSQDLKESLEVVETINRVGPPSQRSSIRKNSCSK